MELKNNEELVAASGSRIPNYDYYDDYSSSVINRKADHHHASYGHYDYCKEDEVSIGLLVTALAGIALMWYTLYTKIKTNGGRRRKRDLFEDWPSFFSFFNIGNYYS